MADWLTMTREERLNEVGTMPPCPMCGRPRVERSCYIRCNPCALNWENGSDLSQHPHRTKATKPSETETRTSAQPAENTTEEGI